jgi:hypothetical protein
MSRHLFVFSLLLLIFSAANLGCVRRRMTIVSDPPGAMVYVDDHPLGITPVSSAFTYYGTRTVKLVKDGFESVTEKHTFHPPWYQIPPVDFVAENLLPYETRDERILNFQLSPQRIVPTDELLSRAESMRSGGRRGMATPMLNAPVPFAPAAPGRLEYIPPPEAVEVNRPDNVLPSTSPAGPGNIP